VTEYQHQPAFEKLCDLADKSGLQVGLQASCERAARDERKGDEFYPQLSRIELWLPGALPSEMPMAAAPIYDDDIEAAALDLLARVA
jgi:hypothetical protein